MACHIQLVQNDTGPNIIVQLTDDNTKLPIDLSAGGTSAVLKFRANGSTTLKDTLTATKLTGFMNPDGTIDVSGAYAVAGAGGRLSFPWGATSLNGTPGQYEGSITVTFPGPVVQTVYETISFTMRPSF